MKIYRHRLRGPDGPQLMVVTPQGTTTKARHTSLGATLTAVQRLAEQSDRPGEWKIVEEDDTERASVVRTLLGAVHTRVA